MSPQIEHKKLVLNGVVHIVFANGKIFRPERMSSDERYVCPEIWPKIFLTKGYPTIATCGKDGHKKFYVHRIIAEAFLPDFDPEKGIDHIDGDPTNNQIENLRVADQTTNMQGFQKRREGTLSKFRGVTFHKGGNKWLAQIRVSGKQHYLGLFECEEHAAVAYDRAATAFGFSTSALNFNA